MTAAKYIFGLILALAASGFGPATARADDPPLGAYNADICESSISGISSGAFMAVQFATAWSGTIWWGYTDFNYPVKAGRQITTIKAMLDRLTRGHVSTRAARVTDGDAPRGLKVNDISDTAVALAWVPLAGAQIYTAYRASGDDQNFAAIGTVAGPSFSDPGLSPATSYWYKVTANAGGNERPASPVVKATTLPVPPHCPAPGSCPIAR